MQFPPTHRECVVLESVHSPFTEAGFKLWVMENLEGHEIL